MVSTRQDNMIDYIYGNASLMIYYMRHLRISINNCHNVFHYSQTKSFYEDWFDYN